MQRYIELLKRSLLNEIYLENELRIHYLCEKLEARTPFIGKSKRRVNYSELHQIDVVLADQHRALQEGREVGDHLNNNLQHLVYAHSMIGRKRMDNLEFCINDLLKNDVPGDFMECGVWQGGACIFMRGMLAAHDIESRKVWLADSFDGLPAPEIKEDEGLLITKNEVPGIAVGLEKVKGNFRKYDLLDDQVGFIKGWFKDTLYDAPVEQLALLRLDGDLYESTMTSLNALYHKVSSGGYIIIDDYGALEQCKRAVDDFRREHNISSEMHTIDWTGAYWKKD